MSREAMKMALEALVFAQYEDRDYDDVCDQKVRAARNALSKALATEQESVECMCGICKLGKREWVGLTEEEVSDVIDNVSEGGGWIDFLRALEAKLKEKNT